MKKSYAVAVDIGGTFTDLVAYERNSGDVLVTKSPTNYDNLGAGILDCFEKAGVECTDVSVVNHGTTLVINSLIQRKGANTALITTKGFRDVLEIARGNRPDPFDLYYVRDEPLIPRTMRFEVDERMGPKGEVVIPLNMNAIAELSCCFREAGVDSVAIFFINSYVNPLHEEQAAALLKTLLPDIYVTHSADLTREWYEYERVSTVAANAFVGQQVSDYVTRLEDDLVDRKFAGSIFMMGSNGGLLSTRQTCRQPIALVESGPIGGCIGASSYARELGLDNVIAFDMGGTTAKCALVQGGSFSVGTLYYAGGYVKGFPIRSPVIDIVEVGAGGGSIAWLDERRRLHVGPQSAGSSPGPVCYSRGGTNPTVTDANLILGRIDADGILGGDLRLDVPAAYEALKSGVADPLGFGSEEGVFEIAQGVLDIAAVTMAGAIRQISIENGLDPRDFALFSYGGGGPLHGSALARELGIPTVIIPPEPGNFSAVGMLLADARFDVSKTFAADFASSDFASIWSALRQLEGDALTALKRDFEGADIFYHHYAEMRYRGQHHEIKVMLSGLADAEAIRNAFHVAYGKRYGHSDPQSGIEFQALHLSAFAKLSKPDLTKLPGLLTESVSKKTRSVYFGGKPHQSDVYLRRSLPIGFQANGPALIEEFGSTTVVWPRDGFEIGRLGEIRIDCSQA